MLTDAKVKGSIYGDLGLPPQVEESESGERSLDDEGTPPQSAACMSASVMRQSLPSGKVGGVTAADRIVFTKAFLCCDDNRVRGCLYTLMGGCTSLALHTITIPSL
jgi:hypothetical protein